MANDTVTINSVELDAKNLLEAALNVAEEPMGEGSSIVDDVFVNDDGCGVDDYVEIYTDGASGQICVKPVREIIEMAEDAIEASFEDHVDGLLFWGKEVTEGAEEWGCGYDALIQCDSGFSIREVQSLIENSEIKVGQFATRDGVPTIGLINQREE